MKITTIKGLNPDELRIIKRIIIISDRNNIETEMGSIIYTRPIDPDYNFIKQKLEDEKQTNSFEKFFQEYPRQRNYPTDEIDSSILESVRQIYPKSMVQNDNIIFNVDLDKLKMLKNRQIVSAKLYFSPQIDFFNAFTFAGRTFKAPTFKINVYTYFKSEAISEQIFLAKYDPSDEKCFMDKLKKVAFE